MIVLLYDSSFPCNDRELAKNKLKMQRIRVFMFLSIISLVTGQSIASAQSQAGEQILKIEMNLSAFGVESDDFPSISAIIDFSEDTSHCVNSFYNPAYAGSTYALTKSEMRSILNLLVLEELEKLNNQYAVEWVDMPRSRTTIYTTNKTYVFDDYGLIGSSPLQELYKLVYHF